MKNLKIALDWTANTNHTGFYVAQKKGFYEELDINLIIHTPDVDNYATTPAKKVELGEADFALCPFESILSYRTKKQPFDAMALATIFQEDVSAIASLSQSNITAPKDLDGRVYASYKARYEDEIVRQMIKNDGGKGEFEIVYPEKLGIWDTILKNTSDATWIFRNWEGVQAEDEGIKLNLFKMSDYGIPYGYSPVLMSSEKAIHNNAKVYADFLEATKKGYLYAQENPAYGADCISKFVAKQDRNIDLEKSQRFTSPYYGTIKNWGVMDKKNVSQYLDWLYHNDLENNQLFYQDLVYQSLD